MEMVLVCIDDLLTFSTSMLEDYLHLLQIMINWLWETNLQVDAEKSHFCVHEVEYLGYYLTIKDFKPLMKKVMAILQLVPPTTLGSMIS